MSASLNELLEDRLAADVPLSGITDDSRRVREGYLFIAVAGQSVDARKFIGDAIECGASAVLCEPPAPNCHGSVPVVAVPGLASKMGAIASRFYGEPTGKMKVVAVTGTNGKTSFAHILSESLTQAGLTCGMIGTLGVGHPGHLRNPGLTTPSAVDLQRRFHELVNEGCQAVVLEASSHGLSQGRLDGSDISIAVFTNLTHDHLDYHKSVEEYARAKQRLFQMPSISTAIVNVDDEYATTLISLLRSEIKLVSYSLRNVSADIYCLSETYDPFGTVLQVSIAGKQLEAKLPLYGEFNARNVLAVIATMLSMGYLPSEIQAAIGRIGTVPGRMDVIRRSNLPTVVIDYAHTPDALEKCLLATRKHFGNRNLVCVFGCGGDRDKLKRPVMGQIAARLATSVVLTDDNPRSEDSATIIAEVKSGVSSKNVQIISDRRAAIMFAIGDASPDSVVVIAGKGHEDYQDVKGQRLPFSDYTVVMEALGSVVQGEVSIGEDG